ncbi:MAG: OmpA family protein [Campylobacterota bacterium]|nr:OmpA family protein [Campylobacterota bacterium]
MKYILINLIVLINLVDASQKKVGEFISIIPISVEYNDIQEQKSEEIDEVISAEEVEENSDIQNMWANPMATDIDDLDDETEELETESLCEKTISGFSVGKDGCPQTYRLKTKFENKKFNLIKDMSEELEELSQFLKENLSYQVIIYSYTDSIGEEDVNKRLTKNRAATIKKILIDFGVSTTKLTAIGKGEKNPIESNMEKAGRSKNNRIEIELIY